MRELDLGKVTETVSSLLKDACSNVGCKFINFLMEAKEKEESPLGKEIIDKIIENDKLAMNENLPMCQDTGIVVCFVELGSEVVIKGDLYEAINKGVEDAYVNGYLRKSVVGHPLNRINTKNNTPAVVHITLVPGDTFKITVAPKGGGSENMSLVKMLIPADGVPGIKKLVIDTVKAAGGKPCPPIIVGLGIGGDLEKAALLAKSALMREIDDESPDPFANKLEKELLEEINNTGVGPMGFGGRVTCLAVKVNCYPCHIASLPVAINIQCHANRHKSATL